MLTRTWIDYRIGIIDIRIVGIQVNNNLGIGVKKLLIDGIMIRLVWKVIYKINGIMEWIMLSNKIKNGIRIGIKKKMNWDRIYRIGWIIGIKN